MKEYRQHKQKGEKRGDLNQKKSVTKLNVHGLAAPNKEQCQTVKSHITMHYLQKIYPKKAEANNKQKSWTS